MTPEPLTCSAFFFLAFVLAGIAQTSWLRSRWSARFARPLDRGRTWRGRRIFGDNKTWRGLVVMVPATGLAFLVARQLVFPSGLWPLSPAGYFLLGCWGGLGFMLGELPNSFLKRQWDIGPGQAPAHPRAQQLCFAIDQVDSVVGGLLALSLVVPVPLLSWVYVLVIGAVIHWGFNLLFVMLGLKTRAA